MRVRFVDLAAQYRSVGPEVRRAVLESLESCDYVLGPRVESFERAFARFVGVKHAVSVSSGADALKLALQAAGVGSGDEVVVPADSYIATALAVSAVGASPVLVDCDAGTWNMDPGAFERAVTAKTKAVIPVHLCGQPAAMDRILGLARARGLLVIEDAAQAAGASYRGRRCGSLGRLGCFSFYPGKNLGAYGDGGCVTTDDDGLAARLRRLRHYGQDVKYEHLEKGWNCRLDAVQAAVLRSKLKRLAGWNKRRAPAAAAYRRALAGVGDLVFQAPEPGGVSCWHLLSVETARRDALRRHLERVGVETVIHYPVPIHLQPAYAELGLGPGSLPNAERHSRRTLSLPLYPEITPRQIAFVCAQVRRFFAAA